MQPTDVSIEDYFQTLLAQLEEERRTRKNRLASAFRAGKWVVEGKRTVWPSKHYRETDPDKLAAHLDARGFHIDIVDREPIHHRPGLSRQDVIRELKTRGFTHMETYGGPIPLDEWKPYGNGIEDEVRFVLRDDNKAVDRPLEIDRFELEENAFYYRDTTPSSHFMIGVWSPLNVQGNT